VTLRQYIFAPFGLNRASFVAVLGAFCPAPASALFALLNFHMGQQPDFTAGETISRRGWGI
jgi:hypothetical protein